MVYFILIFKTNKKIVLRQNLILINFTRGMIYLKKKDIKLIQIFPEDKAYIQRMQEKKIQWFIDILREKYPDDTIERAIKSIALSKN